MGYLSVSLIALLFSLRTLAINVEFTEPSQDAIAADGETLWWNCTVHVTDGSASVIAYWWQYNDGRIQNTSSFVSYSNGTLAVKSSSQTVGQYRCAVSINGNNFYSEVVTLALAYAQFTLSPMSHNTSIGLSIALDCQILSIPPAEITWLFKGNVAKVGDVIQTSQYRSTLIIENLSYQEDGEYRCQAINCVSGDVRFSESSLVSLRGAPQFLSVSEPITSLPGATLYLHCVVLGNPRPIVSWSTNPSLPQGTDVFSNGTIRITSMQLSYSGFYTCTANNSLGSVQRTILVTCSDDYRVAEFSQYPPNVTLITGQTVIVTCVATGVPSPHIWWRNPFGEVINETYIPYNGGLSLTPGIAISGTWTAGAQNAVGETQARFFVIIHEKVAITCMPKQLVVTEKEPLQFICNSIGRPRPTTKWFLPNGGIVTPSINNPGYLLHANGSLTIFSVKCDEDHGNFRCLCENEFGSDSIDISVTVQCKPKILQSPANIEISESSSSSVSCNVIGRPQPQLSWYKGNSVTPIASGMSYQVLANHSLSFRDMKANMIGQYNCAAINKLGMESYTFYVNMLYKPRFKLQVQHFTSKLADVVVLPCDVDAYPTATVVWRKDGYPLVEDSTMQVMSNNYLRIREVYARHYSKYECVATNSVGSGSASIFLASTDDIFWVLRPQSRVVAEEQEVELPCKVVGPPMPLYYWYFQPGLGSSRKLISFITTESLHIRAVSIDDTGLYTCEVTYNNNTVASSAFLNVTKGSQSIISETVEKGVSTTLTAPIDSKPTQTVTWYSPNEVTIGVGVSLYIERVTVEEHWGLWTAESCNATSCSRHFVFLKVLGEPVIDKYWVQTNGSYISIQCDTKGTPTPDVLYYQSQSLISNNVIVPGHFILNNQESKLLVVLRSMQRDPYSCVARNIYGQRRQIFTKPETVNAVVESITATSATIRWTNKQVDPSLIGYKLTHKTANSQADVELSPNSLGYTLTELSAFTSHSVTISSFNQLGESDSAVLKLITSAAAPSPPRQLLVKIQDGCFFIAWTRPQFLNGRGEDISYEVSVNSVDNEEFILSTNKTSVQFYPHSSAVFYIEVMAYNNGSFDAPMKSETTSKSVSFPSTDINILTISPTNVRAILNEENTIHIFWNAIFGISIYEVYYESVGHQTNGTSYEISNVDAASTYKIQVAGVNSAGVGAYSDAIVIIVSSTETETADSQQMSGSTDDLDLLSIIGIILGVLLVAVLVFGLSLLLMSYRNRTKKMDEVRLKENSKPSQMAEDCHTGEVEGKDDTGVNKKMFGLQNDEFKVILTGDERSVDVVTLDVEHGSDPNPTDYGYRDDLSAAVQMLQAEVKCATTFQKSTQSKEAERRQFLQVSEHNPRVQKPQTNLSHSDTTGTMSRRRPLSEAEIL